tara:strand:- start:177 stop:413 length:237 start_codon:yes stop_codon:yes gene_type:complete
MCAIHARITMMAWFAVIPSTSHMAGHLYQRAADAIAAECEESNVVLEKMELRKEGRENARKAHQILSLCDDSVYSRAF